MALKLNLQLSKQQQQMLVLAVLVLGGGGFSYIKYFWAPMSKRINEAKTKIEDIDKKILKAKSQAARLPRIQQELVVLNQQAADAEKRLPKAKDVPAVIDTLSRLARRHRIEVGNFTPGPSSTKPFFIEVPYTLTVTGTYHDIGRFLAAIALEERIFNVRNVTYNASGAGKSEQLLGVTFTLVSYQYKG